MHDLTAVDDHRGLEDFVFQVEDEGVVLARTKIVKRNTVGSTTCIGSDPERCTVLDAARPLPRQVDTAKDARSGKSILWVPF